MIRKIIIALFTLLCFLFINCINAQQDKIKYQLKGDVQAAMKVIQPKEKLPVVGAIRWDGWYYGNKNDDVTSIVEKTLAPKEFHNRLPFFAKEISDDSVYLNGSSQEVMDKEIAWAKVGGLDYWAFVLYPEHSGLGIGLQNYLHSTHRRDINFCMITEQARITPSDTSYLTYMTRLLKEPGYQQVTNGRPLWYLGFIDSNSVIKTWGSFHKLKLKLDSIRANIVEAGFENPYLVIMDFKPELGKQWSDSLGGDAISSYATSKNSTKASYKKLSEETAQFWEECKATGSQVIPICMAGWSPKPRLDYPNIWSHFYPKDVYYSNATPSELAAHIKSGLTWLQNNKTTAVAQCALIYAWNEYDEGGWLGPMLYEGSARLDALAKIIKSSKNQSVLKRISK